MSDWAADQVDTGTETTETALSTTAPDDHDCPDDHGTAHDDDRAVRDDDASRSSPSRRPGSPTSRFPALRSSPRDEMPLPARAHALERRLAGAGKPSQHLINFWLYQHSWIVTGARFGWHDGAEALRILIKVDQSLERRFGFGAKSEVVARRALAYVEAQAK